MTPAWLATYKAASLKDVCSPDDSLMGVHKDQRSGEPHWHLLFHPRTLFVGHLELVARNDIEKFRLAVLAPLCTEPIHHTKSSRCGPAAAGSNCALHLQLSEGEGCWLHIWPTVCPLQVHSAPPRVKSRPKSKCPWMASWETLFD